MSTHTQRYLFEAGLSDEFDIYHGANSLNLKRRPVTADFNSIGCWFSSDPNYAKMFGKVHRFAAPNINMKIVKNPDFKILFFDYEVAEKHFGTALAEALQTFSKTKKLKMTPKLKAEVNRFQKKTKFAGSSLETATDIELFRRLIYVNKEYLEDLQVKWMKYWDGILMHDADIDGLRHDVWLIFEPQKHHMIPKVSVDAKAAQEESVDYALSEGKAVGKLFHFISPEKLALILEKKVMQPLGSSQPMQMKAKYLNYKNDAGESVFYGVSTTRNPIWKPNQGQPWAEIRLTLDGDKLSQKYPIKSYNDFWKWAGYAQIKRNADDEFYAQAEEKIITDKKGIIDPVKYILAVDVLESAKEDFDNAKLEEHLDGIPINFTAQFKSTVKAKLK